MVDYAAFIVDPWKGANQGQKMALEQQASGLAQRRQSLAERQYETESDLGQRRMGLYERAGERQQEEHEMTADEKRRELAKAQINTLVGITESVTDERSHQAARNITKQLVDNGMLNPAVLEDIPEHFDPEWIKQTVSTLRGALGQMEWGEPTPIAGGRGAVGIRSRVTGETKHVVGQSPPSGGAERDPRFEQTLNEEIGDIENQYRNMQSRFFQDEDMRMYREGPPTDPEMYKRLQLEATQALEDDRKALKSGKRPKRLDAILDKVLTSEKEWGAIEEGLPDPTDPNNVKDKKGKPVQFRDRETGDIYQSDGKRWRVMQRSLKGKQ